MSLKLSALSALTALAVGSAQAQSIWPPQPSALSAEVGDYHAASCPKPVLKPYTGPLLIDSKYDQSDASKSTLSGKQSKQSKELHAHLTAFNQRLAQFADYYLAASKPQQATVALACLDQWLQAWAVAGALQSRETNKTGIAARKWSLAAIASTLLKTQALSGGQPQLSQEQEQWLARLAELVIEDYSPRQQPGFAYFNNHDYWAAWAVAATGMLLERPAYIAWGERNFRLALAQITPSTQGDYAYLPNELARGRLAANYTHYALVPLVLLAESSQRNGPGLSAADAVKLQQLANFAVRSVLDAEALSELQGKEQEAVPAHKMTWLLPFLSRYPQHALARQLYQDEDGAVDAYGQLGGRLKPLYPNLP
ncbi:polysaccharide lyase [Pseudomonas sp. J452]|uniref:polysaccharide lyase n=1 Tax=Pseudomonas sp. J452 TaxID=2898441 RepID=UPI0021ADF92B|nr:polysaccharide lyase [Pseudomonas sp. J452]UUY09062.1 polysaccharide lyase [Pseudomonas sp. J452]